MSAADFALALALSLGTGDLRTSVVTPERVAPSPEPLVRLAKKKGRIDPSTRRGAALMTVRIKNNCGDKISATVTYSPGSGAERNQQVSVNAKSSKGLNAYVRWAFGTYQLRKGGKGELVESKEGGEIVLAACG